MKITLSLLIRLGFFSSLVLGLLSCAYEVDKEPLRENFASLKIVGFDTLKTELLEPRCGTSGCHDSFWPPDIQDYQSVIDYSDKIYEKVIIKREMPPASRPPLSDEELMLIKRWFDDGKKQTSEE